MKNSALYLLYAALFFGFFAPVGMAMPSDPIFPIAGQVIDRQGKPISGANIFIKGSIAGTQSAEDGSFQFNFNQAGDTVLIVRHIAMYDVEMAIHVQANMAPLQIRMSEKTTQVEEVEVAVDRGYTLLDGQRATVLRTMDVETTAGGDGDVIGALLTLPGVQQVGHESALFVRGGSQEESKTLIDGLEITHPYYSGIPDLTQNSRFSPHLFEGITFNTGGYSASYGDALSSVLALNTRHHPTNSSSVIALMLYGAKVGHEHLSTTGRTSIGMDLGYSNFGPYYRLIRHRRDWIEAPVHRTANAHFRQNIGEGGLLKWYGYGNISDQKAHTAEQITTQIHNTNAVSLLTYTQALDKNWNIYLGHGYNTNTDKAKHDQEPDDWREQQHQFRVQLQRKSNSGLTLNGGSELFHNRWDHRHSIQHSKQQNTRWDSWAEARYRLSQALTAQAGLRATWNPALQDDFLLMPRASLTYHRSRHAWTASVGQYAQQPARDFYLEAAHQAPILGHAHVDHYLLNYQWKHIGRILRIEGYYKDYKNLMRTLPQVSPDGRGYARGLDFFWRDPASAEGLDYWISYSWLDTKRQYLDYPQQTTPTFAAPHNLHVVAKQFIEPIGVFVGASYSFSAGRPYFNPHSEEFLGDRTPAFHQINLNLALLRKWGNTFHTMVLAVNNLAGRHQIFDYRYTPDGAHRTVIDQPFKRGILIGWFISIGQDRSREILDQLP